MTDARHPPPGQTHSSCGIYLARAARWRGWLPARRGRGLLAGSQPLTGGGA